MNKRKELRLDIHTQTKHHQENKEWRVVKIDNHKTFSSWIFGPSVGDMHRTDRLEKLHTDLPPAAKLGDWSLEEGCRLEAGNCLDAGSGEEEKAEDGFLWAEVDADLEGDDASTPDSGSGSGDGRRPEVTDAEHSSSSSSSSSPSPLPGVVADLDTPLNGGGCTSTMALSFYARIVVIVSMLTLEILQFSLFRRQTSTNVKRDISPLSSLIPALTLSIPRLNSLFFVFILFLFSAEISRLAVYLKSLTQQS